MPERPEPMQLKPPYPEPLEILGVPIAQLTTSAALAEVHRLYESDTPSFVAYANAHTLNLAARDPGYAAVLRRAAIVLNDGAGVSIAGRIRRRPFPENLNGSDLNPRILGLAAREGWPVYLLGAAEGIAAAASTRLKDRFPGLEVAGSGHGFFPRAATGTVVEEIRASGAGLLMVAMGNPRQEEWLDRHLSATGARLGVGVGAFFDFAAGVVPRAPRWMNRAGLEWAFRLAIEPGRLWRRYVLGNPAFLARCIIDARRTRQPRGRRV